MVADETWDRFRQATIDLSIERGYGEFEVSDIVARAGRSRVEFEARFTGKQDCLDGTYGAAEYLRGHRRERRYGEIRKAPGGRWRWRRAIANLTWDVVDEVMYLAVRRYIGDEAAARERALFASLRPQAGAVQTGT